MMEWHAFVFTTIYACLLWPKCVFSTLPVDRMQQQNSPKTERAISFEFKRSIENSNSEKKQ